MKFDVICLRSEADFLRASVTPPASLAITYRTADDPELKNLISASRALVIPAVGGKLAPALFEGCQVKLVQVTGAGVDRLDEAALAKHLASGHLGGAALDVYAQEPPPLDNPLFALRGDAAKRLLFTPHVAGVTRQSSTFLFKSAWDNIKRVLIKGETPLNRVF